MFYLGVLRRIRRTRAGTSRRRKLALVGTITRRLIDRHLLTGFRSIIAFSPSTTHRICPISCRAISTYSKIPFANERGALRRRRGRPKDLHQYPQGPKKPKKFVRHAARPRKSLYRESRGDYFE